MTVINVPLRKPRFTERPPEFEIYDGPHPLKHGLVFFGGGRHPGSTYYHDSSLRGNNRVTEQADQAGRWTREIGRSFLEFDAADDQILLSPWTFGTSWTIAGWAKATYSIWTGFNLIHVDTGGGLSLIKAYPAYGAGDGKAWVSAYYNFGGGSFYSDVAWPQGVPEHYCITKTPAGVVSMYIGGVKQSGTTTTSIGSFADDPTYIGAAGAAKSLGDVCIWDRDLSQSEISALANPGNVMLSLGGSDPGLLRWSPNSRSFNIPIELREPSIIKAFIPL